MSKITFNAKFLSFKEWLKLNPGVEEQEEECDVCDGTGISECFHCGSEMKCDECDGSGVIKTARYLYADQLTRDKNVLKKYQDWLDRAAELPRADGTSASSVKPENTDVE